MDIEIEKCPHGSVTAVDTLKVLPENQAGPGRHKCATCALKVGFETGYQAGLAEGERHGVINGLTAALDLVESHGLASIREKLQELMIAAAPVKKTPVHNGAIIQHT